MTTALLNSTEPRRRLDESLNPAPNAGTADELRRQLDAARRYDALTDFLRRLEPATLIARQHQGALCLDSTGKPYTRVANSLTKALRVGIWQYTSENYSGGRVLVYQFAHALVTLGAEVWLITNHSPRWAKDYPKLDRLYINIFGENEIPLDLDIIVTDGRDVPGRMAHDIWRLKTHKPKLICWSFESSNWMKEYLPETAKKYADERWRDIYTDADLLLSCSRLGARYLAQWMKVPKRQAVLHPYANLHARDHLQDVSNILKRPLAVYSSRISEYKGNNVAYDSIMSLEEPFDFVVFGEIADYMKSTENHVVYGFGNEPDVLKYAAMQLAKFTMVPSLFEGFGMVPAESLSVGTPVIAYDLPVLREVYGDRLHYVPYGDKDKFRSKIEELARIPKQSTGDSREYVERLYSPSAMRERIEQTPYLSFNRKKISAHLLCWWGKSVAEAIESVYPYVDEILVAFGSVKDLKDPVPDGSLEKIKAYPDTEHKIKMIERSNWDNKEEMENWCVSQTTGNYILILDADEIWMGVEEWIKSGIDFGSPRWVNFWHDEKHWVHGKGRWGTRVHPFGSTVEHYRWSYWRNSYYFKTHTSPGDVCGIDLSNLSKSVENANISPATCIYHLGHMLPQSQMMEKHDYYRKWYSHIPIVMDQCRMWENWKGELGACGDGTIEEVKWEVPDIVKRAIASLRS